MAFVRVMSCSRNFDLDESVFGMKALALTLLAEVVVRAD